MLAPKGCVQTVSKEAYMAAQMTANKRVGVLKWRLPMTVLSAALLLLGGCTVYEYVGRAGYLLSGIALIVTAVICLIVWWGQLPAYVKANAAADFDVYDALSNGAAVTFSCDEMTLVTDALSRRLEYAKTRVCVETPDRFVLITDDDAVVILEKACFEDRDNTEAFLRDVFARWYKKTV